MASKNEIQPTPDYVYAAMRYGQEWAETYGSSKVHRNYIDWAWNQTLRFTSPEKCVRAQHNKAIFTHRLSLALP